MRKDLPGNTGTFGACPGQGWRHLQDEYGGRRGQKFSVMNHTEPRTDGGTKRKRFATDRGKAEGMDYADSMPTL